MPSKALISALRNCFDLARKAYWKGETHCGSHLDPTGRCVDCQHWHACCNAEAFCKEIAIADAEGGE